MDSEFTIGHCLFIVFWGLDIAQFSIVSTLQQINDGRDGKSPEDAVVDDGEEVDGDGAVGEEQARSLLQLAFKDLKQGAGLNHGEECRGRLAGRRPAYYLYLAQV